MRVCAACLPVLREARGCIATPLTSPLRENAARNDEILARTPMRRGAVRKRSPP